MKHIRLIALVLSLMMVLSVLPASAQAEKPTVKVGVSIPLTSASEVESAENMLGGINAALEFAKDQGMLDKFDIELVVEDDGGTATTGMNAANKLVYNDGVKAMIGPVQSTVAAVTLPMLEEEEIPSIMAVASPALSQQGYTYFFRANYTNLTVCTASLGYMIENKGLTKIGFLSAQNETCEVALQCSLDYLKNSHNMEPAAVEYFAETDTDFSAQIMSFKNAGCEAILLVSGIVQGAQQVEQVRQLMGQDIYMMGLSNGQTSFLQLISKEDANNSGYATCYDPCLVGEQYDVFRSYYAHYIDRDAVDVSARGYDGMMILITALNSMGDFDVNAGDFGAKLRDAIRGVDYTGMQGKFEYNEQGDGLFACNIIEYIDGARVMVG